ncbi:nuclear transport factor 2 family protein [Actinomadura sp. 9N407]|uniref:nuclear transport factor 2 family protein n=1 Tax=Actinomadura sp. 9N407 TaxID=3375154 RepID=UPI003798ACB8
MTAPGTFRAAVEAKDLDAITRTLDPAIEFRSPVMVKPYQGREAVTDLLRVLLETFEDFHYTHDLAGSALSDRAHPNTAHPNTAHPNTAHLDAAPIDGAPIDAAQAQALVFNARVMGKAVQGVDLITFNDSGLVVDLTVMVRPLPAAMTLARAVGRRMEEHAALA